jgi:hypothetical protein
MHRNTRESLLLLFMAFACADDAKMSDAGATSSSSAGPSSTISDSGGSTVTTGSTSSLEPSTSSSGIESGSSESQSDEAADDVSLDMPSGQNCDGYSPAHPGSLIAENDAELEPFEGIACVEGEMSLTLEVSEVTPLHALEAVGWMHVYATSNLASLDGLNNLRRIADDLFIGAYLPDAGCLGTQITTLAPLQSLEEIGDSLYICENPNLTSIAALGTALSGDFGGTIEIYASPSLESLAGLEGLTSAGDSLNFGGLPLVADLVPLGNLTAVDGALGIAGWGMASMEGLEQLTTAGSFRIVENPQLVSLAGLEGLLSVEDNLSIHDNPMLPQAEAEAFAAGVDVGGSVTICNNLGGPAC